MSLIVNIIVILIMIFINLYLAKTCTYLIPILLLVLYQYIWLIISCAYVEQGVYLTDTHVNAYFTYSSVRLLFLCIAFYIGLILGKKFLEYFGFSKIGVQNNLTNWRFVETIGLGICAILTIILLLDVSISGSVLTNSAINRFNYLSEYSRIGLVRYISYLHNAIFLFLGMCVSFSSTKAIRIISIFVVVGNIVFFALTGNESGAYLTNGLFFCIPSLLRLLSSVSFSKSDKVKIRKACTFLLGAIVLILIYKYVASRGYSILGAETEDSFFYRLFALQSNTWWNIDKGVLGGSAWPSQFEVELHSLITGTNEESGIWFLMKQIMPLNEYIRYVDGFATLNGGYPAINIAIYGWLFGPIVTVFDGLIFYCSSYILYRKIIRMQYCRAIVWTLVFNQIVRVYTMGGIGYLGNVIPKLCFVVFLYIELMALWAERNHFKLINA